MNALPGRAFTAMGLVKGGSITVETQRYSKNKKIIPFLCFYGPRLFVVSVVKDTQK